MYRDEEGEEARPTLRSRSARETARDLIRTPSYAIPDWLDCTLEVTDESGRSVLTLPFAEAADEV
jgi:hypothetical protein